MEIGASIYGSSNIMSRMHRCLKVICSIFSHLSLRQGKLSVTLHTFVSSSKAGSLKELEIIVQWKIHLHLKHCLSASLTQATLKKQLKPACSSVLQSTDMWRKQEAHCCVVILRTCRKAGGTWQSLSLPLPGSLLQISMLVPGGFKLQSSLWSTHLNHHSPIMMSFCQPMSRLKSKENEKATKVQNWLIRIWTCTENRYKHSVGSLFTGLGCFLDLADQM